VTTIGILGAGRVGTAIARAAVAAGYSVNIAASGAPDNIALIAEIMAPGASATTAADAVASADIVVLAIPLHKYRSVDPGLLVGRVVIDAMNYWAPTDGVMDDFASSAQGTSEVVAEHLLGARLVKSINHIGYHELEEDALPAGHSRRRALAVASDDADAAERVMQFIDRLGYDAVNAGPLAFGRVLQPGTVIFGSAHNRAQLIDELERQSSADVMATPLVAAA
jgi:Predicted dinucleotide-binding enzymes